MSDDPIVPRAQTMSQTSRMSQTPDYSGWYTKQQAAEAIGVTTKTVERMAQDGQLQQARRRGTASGQKIAVYHPGDVDRIASARRPGLSPFVLPAGSDVPTNGKHHHAPGALAIAPPASIGSGEELLHAFAAALRTMSETSQTLTLFVTLPEAAEYSGLSQACLRRKIASGTLKAERDRGWKIRRKDLEAL